MAGQGLPERGLQGPQPAPIRTTGPPASGTSSADFYPLGDPSAKPECLARLFLLAQAPGARLRERWFPPSWPSSSRRAVLSRSGCPATGKRADCRAGRHTPPSPVTRPPHPSPVTPSGLKQLNLNPGPMHRPLPLPRLGKAEAPSSFNHKTCRRTLRATPAQRQQENPGSGELSRGAQASGHQARTRSAKPHPRARCGDETRPLRVAQPPPARRSRGQRRGSGRPGERAPRGAGTPGSGRPAGARAPSRASLPLGRSQRPSRHWGSPPHKPRSAFSVGVTFPRSL